MSVYVGVVNAPDDDSGDTTWPPVPCQCSFPSEMPSQRACDIMMAKKKRIIFDSVFPEDCVLI